MSPSDRERSRIQDDLRGLVAGEVRTDPLFCGLYAADASVFWIEPLAVVRPTRLEDIVRCVEYAAERKIPIIPRGAGSGTMGGAVGEGIVIDLSRFLRRLDYSTNGTVRISAGATLERVNQALRNSGHHLPWKTGSGSVTTIGGLVARGDPPWGSFRYGNLDRYLVSIQAVLSDGSVVDLPNQFTSVYEAVYHGSTHGQWWRGLAQTLADCQQAVVAELNSPVRSFYGLRLWSILAELPTPPFPAPDGNPTRFGAVADELIETKFSQSGGAYIESTLVKGENARPFNSALMEHSVEPQQPQPDSSVMLNPARLLIGSEGTLGIITQVEILPPPLPEAQGAVAFFFENLEEALCALPALWVVEPVGVALLDHRHLNVIRETEEALAGVIPREAQFGLFAELEASSIRELRDKIGLLQASVQSVAKMLGPGSWAVEPWDRALFARLAEPVAPALYRPRGGGRPVPFIDYVAIPPEKFSQFLPELFQHLRQWELTAAVYCLPGDGRVFIRPIADLNDPLDRDRLLNLAEAIFQSVLIHHGSINGGGGWGLARSPYLRWQFPQLAEVLVKIKKIFDPDSVLNPGKIVEGWSDEEFRRLFRSGVFLRATRGDGNSRFSPGLGPGKPPARRQSTAPSTSAIRSQVESLKPLALSCFGCGGCRHQWSPGRMCPVFRFFPAEEAAPRAKANLLLSLLSSDGLSRDIASAELREIAEFCVHCHMCTAECPAAVEVPQLMMELKGQHVARAGLLFSDWVMARLDLLAALAARAPRLANWALRTPWTRWLLEKLLGLSQGRRLPAVASTPFLTLANKRQWTKQARQRGPRVAYFADLYVNYFAPELGVLFAKILEHNGIGFFVPEKQRQAGVAAIACGALDIARRFVHRNSRVLAQAVRLGYQVVATEPAAVLSFRREYPLIVPSSDTRLLAENALEACSFLWRLHHQGNLQLDFRPVPLTVGYHQPCRSRALGEGRPGENLLRLIPGLQVVPLPDACSGMAGTFGLKSSNYRASLRGGFPLIASLRQAHLQAGVTECSACKIQLEQGTGKPVLHPIELLACAYGFIPLESLLRPGTMASQ